MKCFNHLGTDAAAVCMNCGKALCTSCILKSTRGKFVCSPICSQGITEVDSFRDYLHDRSSRSWRLLAYALIFPIALVFLVFSGVLIWFRDWPLVGLLGSVVVIFIFVGIGCLKLSKKMVSKDKTDS